MFLGQGWDPDYLYLGLINVKRPMRENRSACGVRKWVAGEVPLRPFFFFRRGRTIKGRIRGWVREMIPAA